MTGHQHLWQQLMDSVRERDRYILQQSLWTDCVFLVGPAEATARRFECHRLMLAKTSPILATMLYGKMFRLGEVIRVIDVTPRAFEKLLQEWFHRYVYEEKVILDDFDAACELLYAAKKYLMPSSLLRQIRGFLWASLYPNNVWRGVQFAGVNDEPEIYEMAWQIIRYKTSYLLKLQDFLSIPMAILSLLLQQDVLACSEIDLFRGCICWAQEQNLARQQQAQLGNPPTLRETLETVIGHIRFLTMTPAEIARGPVKNKILTVEEESALLVAVCAPEMGDIPDSFCKNANKRVRPHFPTFVVLGQPKRNLLNYEDCEDTHKLFTSVNYLNKSSTVHFGVRVPTQLKPEGSDAGTYEEELTLLLYDNTNKNLLSRTRFHADVSYNDIIDVPYKEPVTTEKATSRLLMKIIFHKSGRYPLRNTNNDKCSSTVTGTFGSFTKVKLQSFRASKYIRCCAYRPT